MTKSLTVETKVIPFSLKDSPSLIERLLPAQKISAEAQKERNAGPGQTLTALGSYWKGRKPLVLNKACILGALLPATDNPDKDLRIFEKLMGIDDDAFIARCKSPKNVDNLPSLNYLERLAICYRSEELAPGKLYSSIWSEVNEHLGTNARTIPQLIEQLGIMRFGRRPRVGDTFSGSGQIPFEGARLGCDVYASDLNPVACLLTWGALNIVGAGADARSRIEKDLKDLGTEVDRRMTELGVEHDSQGNKAKAYLYCLEVRCPHTGWMVPVSPTWVVSTKSNAVARLKPDHKLKRFNIDVVSGVTDEEIQSARLGTFQDGDVVYELDGEEYRTSIKTLRGDFKQSDKTIANKLRLWTKEDFMPRTDDIFQERLYAIQWIDASTGNEKRQRVFFTGVRQEDLDRENRLADIVRKNLVAWQSDGFVPDMAIEPGDKTDELIRTRGWTYWHHLFSPRELVFLATTRSLLKDDPALFIPFCRLLDNCSKLVHWIVRYKGTGGSDFGSNVFYNQAFNPFYNWVSRSSSEHKFEFDFAESAVCGTGTIETKSAVNVGVEADLWITDPPYADAVVYHELTEYFIAWLRRNPPEPFNQWTWDSRRVLAIKGTGEEFRRGMVTAYKAMADHMPQNGLQIVMFTHQDGAVWADMAAIMWGAGLQVTAAWYIATETSSDIKKGCYVQGTVLLVLRKRTTTTSAYRDELVQEVKAEVVRQMDTLLGLNQTAKGSGRSENLFEDADLQMAGYAAALRVLTGYTHIDGRDMTAEALRPRTKGEKGVVGEIIDFAVQVANEHLVPEGLSASTWDQLSGSERFYLKMLDIESAGLKKLDNYQNFAKAFRVNDYTSLMSSSKANDARLKTAAEFKKSLFEGEFGQSRLRALLFALFELQKEQDSDEVMTHLRDMVTNYHLHRESLMSIANYIAIKRIKTDAREAECARILLACIQNERLGG